MEPEPDLKKMPERRRRRSLSKRKHHHRRKEPESIEKLMSELPGVQRIVLPLKAQEDIKLVVGDHVTSENQWKYIPKTVLEDHIELIDDSVFKDFRFDIIHYQRPRILMGYAPDETKDYDEFYMVFSEIAEDVIAEFIKKYEAQRDARIAKAMALTPKGPWCSLGSECEIEPSIEQQNRPLYEVEVETEYPVISPTVHFRLRLVEASRDGYAEILPGRIPIESVNKKRIHTAVQSAPTITSKQCQTTCRYPKNAWTEYRYEYEPIKKVTKQFKEDYLRFFENNLDDICDKIKVNDNINFYADDYVNLITDPHYAMIPMSTTWDDYMSFADLEDARKKMITSACWHPMLTGTIILSYGDQAFNTFRRNVHPSDSVNAIVFGINPILIWCFNDGLFPKLQLECHMPVDFITFCPFNMNIVIGGLVNGQVVVWDITNKLAQVEEEEILTTSQQKYRVLMWSMMDWFKNVKNIKRVPLTAQSNQIYSHSGHVTKINWVSPSQRVTDGGQLVNIPEGEPSSLQFSSSSIDGSVLFWDLLAKPRVHGSDSKNQERKVKRLKIRPSALTIDTSPLRCLNRLLKPHYCVTLFNYKKNKALPLSSADVLRTPYLKYEKADPKQPDSMTERVAYKPIITRPPDINYLRAYCGTSDGYVVGMQWEGYEFSTGDVITQECAKITSIGRYHDGPVHSLDRSHHIADTYLSCGGRIFAIWRTDFKNRPVIWRKSRVRYLHGHWAKGNASIFRLSRKDGTRELWSLLKRTDKVYDEQSVSADRVLGSYIHVLPLPASVLGVADNNGIFRLFCIPNLDDGGAAATKMQFMLDREVARKNEFIAWQKRWLANNGDIVKEIAERRRKKVEKIVERNKREQQRLFEEKIQQEKDLKLASKKSLPEPGHFREWAQEQWKIKEEERMKNILLEKHHLNPNLLVAQQMPLKMLEKGEEKKRKKQKEILADSSKIFSDTVAKLFPDVLKVKPPPPINPYEEGFPTVDKQACVADYDSLVDQNDTFVAANMFEYNFDWKRVVQQGIERRREIQNMFVAVSHSARREKRSELSTSDAIKIHPDRIISKPSVTDVNEDEEDKDDEETSMPKINTMDDD